MFSMMSNSVQGHQAKYKKEEYYRKIWCDLQKGAAKKLRDGTRCDCVTAAHAIEVDFAKKMV